MKQKLTLGVQTLQTVSKEVQTAPAPPTYSSSELARRVVDIASDKKASDIVLLDIRPVSYLADYFVVCTGESERQLSAIIDAVVESVAKEGRKPVHSEGTTGSGWILLDYGDVIVHVFSPATRQYYLLEKLWTEASLVLRVQ